MTDKPVTERYLTKSRFKLGLECVTKLYYTKKNKEYADNSLDDPFLMALAEGGFQVGELAKYMFCEDPVADAITVDTLDYKEALRRTNEMLARPGKVVIAEGAFIYNKLFIRADIIVKEGNRIDLYEVKAKSFENEKDNVSDENSMLTSRGAEKVKSDWVPYVYDLAFQKYVMQHALPDYAIHAHLLMVNKNAKATVEGLSQMFRIKKEGNQKRVEPKAGLKAADLGAPVLQAINLDAVIQKIFDKYEVPNDYKPGMKFKEFVMLCEELFVKNKRAFAPIGAKCRDCQFQIELDNPDGLKSGMFECWKEYTKYSDDLLSKPLVTELWGGRTDKFINKGVYLLEQVDENDLNPVKQTEAEFKSGLTSVERKVEQVRRVREGNNESYFDKNSFQQEMSSWKWPLHMIDFETSTVALPFHKDTKPYQGIAFQFSYHIMHENGNVEHADQFLHFEQGVYPNTEFIRALKKSLEGDEGTIFRYHDHENTYLRLIYNQLENGLGVLNKSERRELLDFINKITRHKPDGNNYVSGPRAMVNLYDLVLRYYYPPSAHGSNSLKKILPAIINDSDYLKNKYGTPGVYGKAFNVKSLNFDDQVWISPDHKMDPYKTLPKVFDEYSPETLDNLIKNFEGLADGGAALTAYGYLQFSHIPDEQRERIKNALLRYCELDTLAMVMLVEGWREWK
jgi:hypothetical protein